MVIEIIMTFIILGLFYRKFRYFLFNIRNFQDNIAIFFGIAYCAWWHSKLWEQSWYDWFWTFKILNDFWDFLLVLQKIFF